MTRLAAALLSIIAIAFTNASRAATPEIWFWPTSGGFKVPSGAPDETAKLAIFQHPEQWPNATMKIAGIGMDNYTFYQSTDAQILQIVQFINAHHLKVEMTFDAVSSVVYNPNGSASVQSCGDGEGYSFPPALPGQPTFWGSSAEPWKRVFAIAAANHIQIPVAHIWMDSPVLFGHYAKCKLPIADVVARTAMVMQAANYIAPNAPIGEIEPSWLFTQADGAAMVQQFQQGLSAKLGKPIVWFGSDTQWTAPDFIAQIQATYNFAKSNNEKFFIFYNGSGLDNSDINFEQNTINNIEQIENDLNIIPDLAVITSWNAYPKSNLPETAPAALTYLIDAYARPATAILNNWSSPYNWFVGNGTIIEGFRGNSTPAPDAPVSVYQMQLDFQHPLATKTFTGVVPPTAHYALIGVNIGVNCGCTGANDVVIGPITYTEAGGTARNTVSNFPSYRASGVTYAPLTIAGQPATRVIQPLGSGFNDNGRVFPVTPGSTFSFTVTANTVTQTAFAGLLNLIWAQGLDANGGATFDGTTAGANLSVLPDVPHQLVATVMPTNGVFSASGFPALTAGHSIDLSVEYPGIEGVARPSRAIFPADAGDRNSNR